MAFFNRKEDVIDIELTPYGEVLLSNGKFKPTYYAFFDDNVLYDSSGSIGMLEVQNDVEVRIKENTPQNKTQYLFSGIETRQLEQFILADVDPALEPVAAESVSGITSPPQFDTLIEPLGSMELGSEFAPSWDIKVLQGELTGAVNYLTSSQRSPEGEQAGIYSNVKQIPQLSFDVTYRVLVGNSAFQDPFGDMNTRRLTGVYPDGTFLYLSEEYPQLIFAIDEEHASIDVGYDIEVFMVEEPDSSTSERTLVPMYFPKKQPEIVDDILMDVTPGTNDLDIDSRFVEYFFQLNTDLEIPEEEICPVLGDLKARGVGLNDIPYECKDVQAVRRFDIYQTDAGATPEEEC